jgi:hypothetical protein
LIVVVATVEFSHLFESSRESCVTIFPIFEFVRLKIKLNQNAFIRYHSFTFYVLRLYHHASLVKEVLKYINLFQHIQ